LAKIPNREEPPTGLPEAPRGTPLVATRFPQPELDHLAEIRGGSTRPEAIRMLVKKAKKVRP